MISWSKQKQLLVSLRIYTVLEMGCRVRKANLGGLAFCYCCASHRIVSSGAGISTFKDEADALTSYADCYALSYGI